MNNATPSAAAASSHSTPAILPAMPRNTTIEEMASERWCQALALSMSEPKRCAARKVYRYSPSLARIVKPDTHRVRTAGGETGEGVLATRAQRLRVAADPHRALAHDQQGVGQHAHQRHPPARSIAYRTGDVEGGRGGVVGHGFAGGAGGAAR